MAGPLIVAIAAIAGGAVFLISHGSHTPSQPSNAAAARLVTASQSSGTGPASAGVHLSGHVIGTPHLRSAPSSTAAVLQDLRTGESVDVAACSLSCDWYLVSAPGQAAPGWVSSAFIAIQGDERKLTIVH